MTTPEQRLLIERNACLIVAIIAAAAYLYTALQYGQLVHEYQSLQLEWFAQAIK